MKPDSFDEKLASLLGDDALQNSEQLAKKLNVSSATIRRRLKKLLKNGFIHIVGLIDPADFGYPLATITAINVEKKCVIETVKQLSKRKEIRWISETTGRYDIIFGASFSSLDSLSEFNNNYLCNLEGLKDSETFVCLKEWLLRKLPVLGYEADIKAGTVKNRRQRKKS